MSSKNPIRHKDLGESFWFDADLIEQIDDGEGTEFTLDGIAKKWIKGKNSEWIEEDRDLPSSENKPKSDKLPFIKRWWKFWD